MSPLSEAAPVARLTCPLCGREQHAEMPADACIYFFECAGCGGLLKPRAGDCCVFCSYGDRPCPPKAAQAAACAC